MLTHSQFSGRNFPSGPGFMTVWRFSPHTRHSMSPVFSSTSFITRSFSDIFSLSDCWGHKGMEWRCWQAGRPVTSNLPRCRIKILSHGILFFPGISKKKSLPGFSSSWCAPVPTLNTWSGGTRVPRHLRSPRFLFTNPQEGNERTLNDQHHEDEKRRFFPRVFRPDHESLEE
jgi:hypothetical protein